MFVPSSEKKVKGKSKVGKARQYGTDYSRFAEIGIDEDSDEERRKLAPPFAA